MVMIVNVEMWDLWVVRLFIGDFVAKIPGHSRK